MAPRGRNATESHDVDRSYDSSPDPLALSVNENKVKAMRNTTQKEPLTATSPSKQNTRLSLSDLGFSSPSKSLIMSTPRMGNASPWRIKVTVQAEPGSDAENAESPSVKRVTRTKTTTIPLKDPDAQSPAKRPRGRPRKSDVGLAAKPKRNGTPLRRVARSKSRDASIGAVESNAADVDTDIPPKKRRGRPRKSVQPPIEDDETLVIPVTEPQDRRSLELTPPPAMKSTSTSSKKSTRFAPPQTVVPAIDSTDATSEAALGKTLRARKGTPHSKKVVSVDSFSDEESEEHSDVLTPSSEDEIGREEMTRSAIATRTIPDGLHASGEDSTTQSSRKEHDLQSSTDRGYAEIPSVQVFEVDEDEDVQDITNFAFDEGATRMPDDTTVLDSENFSMISVDSLPSNGGMSSPPKPEDLQSSMNLSIGSVLQHDYLKLSTKSSNDSAPLTANGPSPDLFQGLTSSVPTDSLCPVPTPRYKTPVVDTEVPSEPPAIEPLQTLEPKTETPKLGRVVTAGVALQGVLDPSRLTPQPSQKAFDEKRDELDDLFRGFSEGTRRELQAGLRLGEQLAKGQTKGQSSPAVSSPIKAQPEVAPREGVFRTQRKYRQSRLLTPEEQDDHIVTPEADPVETNNIQYPSLNTEEVQNSLLSPARSEDEMSWRVDTPPVIITTAERGPLENVSNERRHLLRGHGSTVTANTSKHIEHEDYSDIWQEEASRSSNSSEGEDLPAKGSPQLQDLFADDGPIKPARGKLPKTWRRTSANNFQYSDEAESPQQVSPAQTASAELASVSQDKGKAKLNEVPIFEVEEIEDEDDEGSVMSDASDDTGMFFQSNMPNIFNKKRSTELKQKKVDKLSLSTLLNEGGSLLPESSPPIAAKESSSGTKTNPFLDTPPRFPGYLASPKKSSPLRRELRGSDISSDSPYRIADESSLPLPQSSPFHTFVDGETVLSTASDQRQFRAEMEGSTASSIRRVRNEANEYLDAYEPQERSLNEITEVTEPSRTWHKDASIVPSSPPRRKQSFAQSMLSPTRRPVPLFSSHRESDQMTAATSTQAAEGPEEIGSDESSAYADTEPSSESATQAPDNNPPTEEAQQPTTGILSRLTSTLFEALSRPTPSPPHPILSRLTPLPKIEPWTKTHYKALDKLYTTHLKHPALFSPSISPPTPLSQTNTSLLHTFLATNKHPYVGAVYSAWGYSMVMSEELVVLCAVYMQLLSLEGIDEYERVSRREIQMGDCAPGRSGEAIKGDDVVRRLATVVLGEEVRRDEKAGRKIERREGLSVVWPQ
ncbi:Nn.00g047010.m01.CDS01 [Neocucurbitaria sp. VM-36]